MNSCTRTCRNAGLLIALALFCANSPALGGGQTALGIQAKLETLASRAQTAQSHHDYASAAHDYEQMLKLRPDIAEIRANLGFMEHLLGQYDQAMGNFRAALSEKPALLTANLFLGVDLLQQKHPRQALPYLEKTVHLDPQNLQARLSLGRAYARLGEFDKANENYRVAAARDPQNTDARYGLGITYIDMEQAAAERLASCGKNSIYEELLLAESFAAEGWAGDSIRIYRSLLVSHAHFTGLHADLGFAYVQRGEIPQARTEFNAELLADPRFLPARMGLARVDLERGNTGGTIAILQQLWETDPAFVEANVSLLGFSGDSRKSATLQREVTVVAEGVSNPGLREVLANAPVAPGEPSAGVTRTADSGATEHGTISSPDRLISKRTSARNLFASGRYSACTRQLRMGKERLDPAGLNLLAECGYFSGAYRTSFQATEMILEHAPDDPEALYWRAKSAMRLAFQSLMEAGLANPASYRVHLLLAEAYLTLNRFPQAESEYQRVLKLRPDNLAAEMGLGFSYWKELKPDQALPYLKHVLAANPGDTQASFITGEILVERHQYCQARPYLLTAIAGTGRTALSAHALLGKIDAAEGETRDAIGEINKALPIDADGSLHVQLYQLYKKLGDRPAARAALRQSELIQQQHERADRSLIGNP